MCYKTEPNQTNSIKNKWWELCMKLKFHHNHEWNKHKPESVLENEKHTILLNFEIQIDNLIPTQRPDLVLINKKKEFII